MVVSIGTSRMSWVGVGLVYVLTAVAVFYWKSAGAEIGFKRGIGVYLTAVLMAILLNGFWIAAQYSPLSVAFWDVLLSDVLRTVIVAAAIPVGLSKNRWQYLVSVIPIPILIGIDIAETIQSSLPYERELTIAGHFLELLQYNIQILVEGLIFGIPIYIALRGVPPTVDKWLSAEGDN